MSAVAGADQDVWSYVSLTVNRPWFFVEFALHTEDGDIDEQMLLSEPEQVVDLFRRNGTEITVGQLMLVSPRHFNKTDRWQMDQLVEIWRAKHGRRTFMYRLADGRECLDESGVGSGRNPEELTCLVRFVSRETENSFPSAASTSAPRETERDEDLFAIRLPH